ncbi:MAG: Holliday junction resolvase RuvX [Deltaproteobacteria bacterium]|nr:Holliday junction resolvase RuvX [Deltaproteobacteria bacterium]
MEAGRVLGVDFGDRRVGLAVSDESRTVAFPHDVLELEPRERNAAGKVGAVALRLGVSVIVVGVPYTMEGRLGEQAAVVLAFIRQLEDKLKGRVRVVGWDERLTSVQAERAMQEAGLSSRKQRGRLDKVAAALLLQAWLDHDRMQRGGDS